MAPSFAIRVNEKCTFLYTGTLVDENGSTIAPAQLSSLILTLYDLVTGTIINGRDSQNVLNANNVTLSVLGALAWDAPELDNPILNDTLETEVHIARFEWTYGTGLGGKKEIAIRVVNLSGCSMWTYGGDPNGSSKDAVRFLIQDVNTSKQLVQDEEIEFAVAQEANVYCAAASLCEMLVTRAGGVKMKKIDKLTIWYDPMIYSIRAGQLRARGAGHQVPYAGGISIADKTAQQSDTDWVTPAVVRNLDNNPAAPSPQTPPSNPLTTI